MRAFSCILCKLDENACIFLHFQENARIICKLDENARIFLHFQENASILCKLDENVCIFLHFQENAHILCKLDENARISSENARIFIKIKIWTTWGLGDWSI